MIFTALFASATRFRSLMQICGELAWLREFTRDFGARVLLMVRRGVVRDRTALACASTKRDARGWRGGTRAHHGETAVAMLNCDRCAVSASSSRSRSRTCSAVVTPSKRVGVTYSAYASRGFFELVGAATLVGVLLFALGMFAVRGRAFLVAALSLLALTSVVLASAALRMSLYQQAYGWSELRLYANALIALLAIALVLLAVAALTRRMDRVPVQLLVAAAVVALSVNAIGPARPSPRRTLRSRRDPRSTAPYRGLDSCTSWCREAACLRIER